MSPTISRKLGWRSDNLLSSGDFDTELQMLYSKMQTSDSTKNRKARLEFAKKHKGEPEEFWTDEAKMNLYLSDEKAKVWKKGNYKRSQAYSLICKAW